MKNFDVYIPTRAVFGAGELDNLHRQTLPGQKALLVISKGRSARSNGSLERLEKQMHMAGVKFVLFDKVEANPLSHTVMLGGEVAKKNGCDIVVALGGGSVIDAAKAISVMAANGGDYWDYVSGGSGRGMTVRNKPLPLVAIPTTAGTGSESDAACVITNAATNEKTGFGHPSLFPILAVIDPELIESVPPTFTAYQGFDALFHSVEGYISNRANAMSDMYALNAIGRIAYNLPTAVKCGSDKEARSQVAFGSYLSGLVMCVGGVTSQHSLEHAMSAYHQNLPHGAGLIMISKAYFSHMLHAHACDDRFVDMARAMGVKNASSPKDFISALCALQKKCGVGALKMSDYGISWQEAPVFAANARETMGRLFLMDRVPISETDCVKIYEESFR